MTIRDIRKRRRTAKIRICQLAALTGLPSETISHYERGRRQCPLDRLRRLEAALRAIELGRSVARSTYRQIAGELDKLAEDSP